MKPRHKTLRSKINEEVDKTLDLLLQKIDNEKFPIVSIEENTFLQNVLENRSNLRALDERLIEWEKVQKMNIVYVDFSVLLDPIPYYEIDKDTIKTIGESLQKIVASESVS